tara:strand:- start:154 stop:399 length:246 start_codon:yes stop_codon:yes gene_type:complete
MKIDKDVPIPIGKRKIKSKYDWSESMEVGHSVAFNNIKQANNAYIALRKRFGSKRHWILRTLKDGTIRIWRVSRKPPKKDN